MPRRDGTGPRGEGPLTGWGFGRCVREVREVVDERIGPAAAALAGGLGLARRLRGRRGPAGGPVVGGGGRRARLSRWIES